ncbi:Zinc finger BED domain-containing protein RICESLEEPER 3 [Sesamum angolense]|uniref:Zinc finger BED domain-containing protein RICESLEEPER 3 n=1 Tax=Sesamum angolense TaxID=2727404 RepID=A0AAE1WR20_9LAMI|nr:Zinc finger BED domain-containing protein RICESLEEPER 3 [Sesamum angolense]
MSIAKPSILNFSFLKLSRLSRSATSSPSSLSPPSSPCPPRRILVSPHEYFLQLGSRLAFAQVVRWVVLFFVLGELELEMESQSENTSQPSVRESNTVTESNTEIEMSKDIPDRVEIEETSEDNSKRKRTSEAWNHFKRVKVEGIQFAECNYCKTRLKASAGYGTTHLHKHYEKVCKQRPRKTDIRQSFLKANQKVSGEQELGTHIFNQEEARRELASMVILHDYPLSVVDHIGFRRYSTCLQPCFNMISRNTMKGDILKIYKDERTKYYNLLGKIKCRIAITTDMWTSSNNKAPHTAEVLADTLVESLMDWNIDRKVSTITVDIAQQMMP